MREHDQKGDGFLAASNRKGRGLAFLRFLAFVVLACALCLAGWFVAAWGFPSVARPKSSLEVRAAMQIVPEALGALAATALMAWASRRPIRDFGMGGTHRTRRFVLGIVTGFALMSLLLLGLGAASVFSFGTLAGMNGTTIFSGLFYAFLMLGVAIAEETLFRGYALIALSECLSFWPAALVLSALFGFAHSVNDGESALGLASATVFGVVLAYSYRYSGSLWFAYGFHASWDYAESFVFGVPNSGIAFGGSLFQPRFHGPSWLTGGSAGPEASALMVFVFGTLLFVVWKFLKPPGNTPAYGQAEA